MVTEDFIKEIRELIKKDRVAMAIDRLHTFFENTPHLNEIILQSARHHEILKRIRLGTISEEEASPVKSQIRWGILALLDEISTESYDTATQQEIEKAISVVNSKNVIQGSKIQVGGDFHQGDQTIHTESETSRWLRLFLLLFVPFLAITAAYLWYRNQVVQVPFQLKVQIENKTPNPELPEPSGVLTLTYGTKSDSIKAVTKEARFEEIPYKFKEGQLVRLQYHAVGFLPRDTTFLVEHEMLILPVWRNNDLAMIKGIIEDEDENRLQNVKVSIACCNTVTDSAGAFKLNVPFADQRMKQRIDLYKKAYEPKSITSPIIKNEIIREYLKKEKE